jgi:hypothetical protein
MTTLTLDNKRAAMNYLIGQLHELREEFRTQESRLELRISRLAGEIAAIERALSTPDEE